MVEHPELVPIFSAVFALIVAMLATVITLLWRLPTTVGSAVSKCREERCNEVKDEIAAASQKADGQFALVGVAVKGIEADVERLFVKGRENEQATAKVASDLKEHMLKAKAHNEV